MRVANYKQFGRGAAGNALYLFFTPEEFKQLKTLVGPEAYTVSYSDGLIIVQSAVKGAEGAVRPSRISKGYGLLQSRKLARSVPENPFGALDVPEARMVWEKGALLVDIAELDRPPVLNKSKYTKNKRIMLMTAENGAQHSPKVINGSATEVTLPNPKLARQVYTMLDDVFDETKGFYRNGYSDEHVAKETGASLDFVIKTRREAYGELKEDPKIGQLRNEIGSLRVDFENWQKAYTQHIEQLEAKLQNLTLAQKYK